MARKNHRKTKLTVSLGEFHNQCNYFAPSIPETDAPVQPDERAPEDEDLANALQEEEDFEYAKSLNNTVSKQLRSFIPPTAVERDAPSLPDFKFKTRSAHLTTKIN
jgi:hypothetical protein